MSERPDKSDRSDKSDKRLAKIEKSLAQIAAQQSDLCAQLARLTDKLEQSPPDNAPLIEFLDQFRAGEALGEASLGAWIAVSKTECLRGGLRTVQMREGMHARLLEQRIKELGGSPSFELPEAVYEKVMEGAGDPDKSDAQKVLEFTQQFPDIDQALARIYEHADKADEETQSLLRTIAQDERSTLEFLVEACGQLNPA
jgi:septal ring factor EnvC (AmiA/AmiB activator)